MQVSGASCYPIEADYETMLGSEAERSTAPDCSLAQAGDLSFLVEALPMQMLDPSNYYATPAQGTYWQQAVQAKSAAPPKARRATNSGATRQSQVMLFCGLLIACLSVCITLWQAFSPKPRDKKPNIKSFEDGHGGNVIIVRE